MTRSVFQRPLEDAVRALVRTVLSEATMKVRWNACYALGNAFRNPALPLGKCAFAGIRQPGRRRSESLCFSLTESAPWSHDAFSALCHVVTSCQNFKVRIKSAAALAVPARRGCYGDTTRFAHVWCSLATALKNSEDTNDFLEYRYSASLRHTLAQALLHLLGISEAQDVPVLGASLAGEEGKSIVQHLVRYLKGDGGGGGERDDEAGGERNSEGDSVDPQQRIGDLQQTLVRLKGLKAEGEGCAEEERKQVLVCFIEDLLKICEEL